MASLLEEASLGGGVADTGLDFLVVVEDGVDDGDLVNALLVDAAVVVVDKGDSELRM